MYILSSETDMIFALYLKVFRLHLKSSAEIRFLSVRISVDIVITSVFSSNIKLKWSIFLTLLNLWLLVGTLWHCCGDCSYYSVTFSWRQGPDVVEIPKNKRHFQHILYIPANNSWTYFCNYHIYCNKRPFSNKYPLPLFMGKVEHMLPKLALGHQNFVYMTTFCLKNVIIRN